MAGVPPEGEENPEPLKYTTWFLRVSIHCEGCKRKVKRILHSIEGVYTIDVQTKQHKVIVTGNVDSNTLIRKLEKSGKHAELWSDYLQKSMHNINNDPYSQDHHHQQQQQQQPQQQQFESQPNQTVNPEEPHPSNAPPDNNSNPNNGNTGNNVDPNGQNYQQQPEQTNPPENTATAGDGGSGGGPKKKKKRKGKGGGGGGGNNNNNNNNNNNGEGAGEQAQANGGQPSNESAPPQPGPGSGQSPYPNPCPGPVNMSPPGQPSYDRVYEYAPAYYAPPPPPVYAVSYNTHTGYPSSYTASYYSAPMPYSYSYVHHGIGADVEPPPPSDTFEIFSDENPNACSVM